MLEVIKMRYDKNGLGFSELAYIAVNYPQTYETLTHIPNDTLLLKIARQFIDALDGDLIEGGN